MIEQSDPPLRPIYHPADGRNVTSAVVMLHGFASSGEAFNPILDIFSKALPNAAIYAPDGPKPLAGKLAGTFCWYPLPNADPDALRRNSELQEAYYAHIRDLIEQSAPAINRFIDRVLARYALPSSRLALVGFSQGCMVSLHVALTRVPSIGAIVGYSGQLIGTQNVLTKPPVVLIHGAEDPVIPPSRSVETSRLLIEAGVRVNCHIIPGLKHAMNERGAAHGALFLAGILQ